MYRASAGRRLRPERAYCAVSTGLRPTSLVTNFSYFVAAVAIA
jgi:hypothetical protein